LHRRRRENERRREVGERRKRMKEENERKPGFKLLYKALDRVGSDPIQCPVFLTLRS